MWAFQFSAKICGSLFLD
jgi:hypothetical protein